MTTVFDSIFSNKTFSENIALITESQEEISFRNLQERIEDTTVILKHYGIGYGHNVLLFLPNSEYFISYLFGIIKIGGIAVLVDTKFNFEILSIIYENNIELIITDTYGESKIDSILKSNDNNPICFSGTILNVDLPSTAVAEQAICSMEQKEITGYNDTDTAILLYTSGSTNKPKGVEYSHYSISCALDNYLATVPVHSNDVFLGVTPFFHSYALGSCLFTCLASGARLILLKQFMPRKVLEIIDKHKVSIFHGVPYMFNLLNQHFKEKYNFTSLRYCISAGASLSSDISGIFFNNTGKVIHQEYGSTETNTIAINIDDPNPNNTSSVGKPLNGVKVRLVKDEEMNVETIQVLSRALAKGYLNEKAFERDWFNSGDMAGIDDNGNIHLKGRVKNLINISGLKLNPREVEEILINYPGVKEALVKGSAHDDFGEIAEAFVVTDNPGLKIDDVRNFCLKMLATYKVPKFFHIVEELPKNTLGKRLASNNFNN